MQRIKAALAVVVALALLLGSYPLAPLSASTARVTSPTPAASAPVTPAWPKVIDRDGNHIIVYQPQLKSWEKYRTLVADTAISVTPTGGKQFLGVISWRANTVAVSSPAAEPPTTATLWLAVRDLDAEIFFASRDSSAILLLSSLPRANVQL